MRGWEDERLRDENDCSYMKKGRSGEKGRREGRNEKNGKGGLAITAITVKLHNDGKPYKRTAGFAVAGALTILLFWINSCTSFTVAMVTFPTSSKMSRISDSVSTLCDCVNEEGGREEGRDVYMQYN